MKNLTKQELMNRIYELLRYRDPSIVRPLGLHRLSRAALATLYRHLTPVPQKHSS